jgi:V-type H+-transporting ATPase subunit C
VQCREVAKEEEKENGGADDKEAGAARLKELQRSLESKRGEVATWCRTSYGEAFSGWVHICAVRLFVESVLRYGLPPQFLGAIIQPGQRSETKVWHCQNVTHC